MPLVRCDQTNCPQCEWAAKQYGVKFEDLPIMKPSPFKDSRGWDKR